MQAIKASGATTDLNNNITAGMAVLKWAGKQSSYSGGSSEGDTYYRYSNHGSDTMANWVGVYGSITEIIK